MKHCILLLLLLCLPAGAFAQRAHYLLALSKGEKNVTVLDYRTLEVVAKIPVGDDPHEVVTSTDGLRAYISHPLLNGNGHRISVINLATLSPEAPIDTRPFYTPHGMAFRDGKLWVTAQGAKSVFVYDLNEGQVTEVFGTGQDFTHLIHLDSSGRRFYTANVESGTLSIYEQKQLPPYIPPTGTLPPGAKPRLEWRQTLVPVGNGAEGFDVSPDGKTLWTARPDGHIVVVDLEREAVQADIDTRVPGLHRLKFTPDGKTVCIVSVKTGDLLFYNAATRRKEHQVRVGQGAGIYMDAGSNRVFVSCTPNDYLLVLDLATRKEVRRIPIGRPDGVTAVWVP